MTVALERAPAVDMRGRLAEELRTVGLTESPLVDRGVHEARLGITLPGVVDEDLLQGRELELVGLFLETEADGEGGVDLLEERRLRVKAIIGIDDVVLDVAYRLEREGPIGPGDPGLID